MVDQTTFTTPLKPTWCPGCGGFGIWGALKNALIKQGIGSDDVCVIYDVGCSGNMADFIKSYGIHGLHGRAISTAIGVHMADHTFPVVAIGGDGGLYGEGIEHLIEAIRGNFNITVIVHNNGLYSLTTGQRSPLTYQGKKTKSTPSGNIERPFEPLQTAIIHEAGFVARGFSANIPQLTELITAGMQHKGFSIIEVLQPCPSFNKEMPLSWYTERVYKLESMTGLPKQEALAVLSEEPDKLATGVIYTSDRPTYDSFIPFLGKASLLATSIEHIDLGNILKSFI